MKNNGKGMTYYFPLADKAIVKVITDGSYLFEDAEINSDHRIRMFLAQMAHESARFNRLRELKYRNTTFEDKYGMDTRVGKVLGNTEPGDGDKYSGRGLIQLTGRWNYARYGKEIGEDLINNPDLAQQPFIALKLACAYWRVRRLNRAADIEDVKYATKLINGGTNGLKDREGLYKKLKDVTYRGIISNKFR